jgi:serine/threonine protein kinase
MTENEQTKVPAAIKVIKKAKLNENEVYMDLMRNELTVLQSTDHPHITRIFELLEDKLHFYVVMEFLSGGDLMGQIEKMETFSESHVAHIVHQIMLALNYMHSKNVSHRDLKPENMMVSKIQGEDEIFIKLTDFGFACFFDP